MYSLLDQGSIMMPPSTPRAFTWQAINHACATRTRRLPASLKLDTWCTEKMYISTASSTSGRINYVTHRAAMALHQLCRAPQLLASDHSGSTSTTLCATARLLVSRLHWLLQCVRSLRLVARLLVVRIAPALLHICRASGRTVSTLDFSSVGCTGSRRVPGHSVVCRDYLSRSRNGYTSTTPCVRVPRHVARLITPLVIDYFAYAARLGASARRAAHHAALRRLLRLCCVFGCLGMSCGSSHGS
jgi:hypothetical protein